MATSCCKLTSICHSHVPTPEVPFFKIVRYIRIALKTAGVPVDVVAELVHGREVVNGHLADLDRLGLGTQHHTRARHALPLVRAHVERRVDLRRHMEDKGQMSGVYAVS